jgi:hypothetical protein
MIKCPHCGSTAQIQLNTPPSREYLGMIITKHKCGCGCVFVRKFKYSGVQVISDGEVCEPTSLVAQGMIKKMKEYYDKRE